MEGESSTSLLEGAPGSDVGTQVAATPAAPSYVLPDGSFAPGWLDALGPELKGNPSLSTVPSLKALADSYLQTKSLVGKKFQAPSESSTPEEIAAWRKNVGAPETPDGYGDLRPEDFPEDQWDGESAKALAGIAHKHHLPASAVKDIIGLHAEQVKGSLAKYQADEAAFKAAGLETLKKEWGAEFDQKALAAKTFAKSLGLDPDKTMEFASPDFVLAMARGHKLLMGDTLIPGAAPGVSGGIQSRISDLQRSPEYLGERGEQAQLAAQSQLHALYSASNKSS